MRLTKAFAVALALSGAACSDTTDPVPGETTPVTLVPCNIFGLGWFAYQNQGGPWTQLTPNASGGISFDATEKVSVAMSFNLFGTSFTQVINATAAELQGTSGVECDDLFGDKFVSGSVSGLTGDQYVRMTAGTSVDDASLSDPNWILEDLPSSAVDIVATRYPAPFSEPANRVVVRRGVVPQNGAVSALDFNSTSESGVPQTSTVTLTGASTASTFFVESSVITANGTEHELSAFSGQSLTGGFSYLALPAALRVSTDRHVIYADATGLEGSWSIEHYYQTPVAKTLTFGPMVSAPTITTASSSPYVRPRAQIAAQQQYPTAAEISFSESTGELTSRVISVVTTSGFTGGTPQTWDITLPDMSSANFPAEARLQTTTYNWAATAYSAPSAATIVGGVLPDGATITSATRSNGVSFNASARVARRTNLLKGSGVGLR